ncbi:MAG: phage tail tape measure protein, partial [Thermoguttaceae bacterium]|nr:phage tail tape measure protein [Thermoguttaceae bacterium]
RAKELGRTTSFTAAEVANAMAELGRAGFKAPQIDAAINSVMNLSRATQTEIPLATEIAGNALRAFNLDASEMERVCDVMTATANNSSQTLEDLGEAFKFVAPIAADAGLSIEDASKIVGTLANFGIKGSLAGTAFKNIQLKMADPKVQKSYEELGISVTTADGSLRNMADVLRDLGAATASMPNAEKLATYKDLFSMYGLSGGIKLTSANFTEMYDAIDNAQGVAAETAATMDSGIGGSFRSLESAVEGVAHAIGEALTPKITELAGTLIQVAGETTAWIKENEDTVETVASVAAGVALFGGSLLAVGTAAKVAASTTTGLRAAWSANLAIANALTGATRKAEAAQRAESAAKEAAAVVEQKQAALDRANVVMSERATLALQAEAKARQAATAAQTAGIATDAESAQIMRLKAEITTRETAVRNANIRAIQEQTAAEAAEARAKLATADASANAARAELADANATLANANSKVRGAASARAFAGALRGVVASIGPLLAFSAVTAAVTAFANASSRATEAARKESDAATAQAQANAELRSEHERMFERLEELSEKSNLSNAEFAEGCEIAKQLQNAYGDLGITIDATAKKFGGLTEAARKYKEAQIEQEIRDKQAQYAKLGNEDKAISREFKALQGSGGFWKGVGSWFGGQSLDDRHAELSDRRSEIRTEQANLANDVALLQAQLSGMRQDAAQTAQNPQGGEASSLVREEEEARTKRVEEATETAATFENDNLSTDAERRKREINKKYDEYVAAQTTLRDEKIAQTGDGAGAFGEYAANIAKADAWKTAELNKVRADESTRKWDEEATARQNERSRRDATADAKVAEARLAVFQAMSGGGNVSAAMEAFKAAEAERETSRRENAQTDAESAMKRFANAQAELEKARKSGDKSRIEAAEEESANAAQELTSANSTLDEIIRGSFETAQKMQPQLSSQGTFNAWEAGNFAQASPELEEMKRQTDVLERIERKFVFTGDDTRL